MKTIKKSLLLLGTLALCVLSFSACREKKDPAAELAAKGKALWDKESYAEAAAVYKELRDEYPSSSAAKDAAAQEKLCRAKALFREGRALARAGRGDGAAAKLTEAVVLAPDDVEINYGIGTIYMQLALDHLSRAARATGSSQLNYAFLSKAHAELAKARFDRCVKLNPKNWLGHRGLGIYYMFNGDRAKSLASLTEAEKYAVKPQDKVAVMQLRFQVYADDGKRDEAKKILDDMLTRYPEQGEVYTSLASYHLQSEKPDVGEAIKALEVGVSKEFDDPANRNKMYLMLAQLRLSTKDVEGATAAVEAVLATDPFNEAATTNYTLCYEARIALSAQNKP